MSFGAFQGQAFTPNPNAGEVFGAESEWWAQLPEAQRDARNIEFNDVVLPSNLAWYVDGGGSQLAAHTAVNNVTLTRDSLPAANTRYKIHSDRRRSWLQCQVPASGVNSDDPYAATGYYLLAPLTPAASECYWTRIQATLQYITGGSGQSPAMHYFVLLGTSGGLPDKATSLWVGAQGNPGSGGGMATNVMVSSGGARSFQPAGVFQFSQGLVSGFGIRRRSSTNWSAFFMGNDSSFYRELPEFTGASIGGAFATFTPAYIGWRMRMQNASGINSIFGMDLLRYSTDVNTLPL